MRTIRSISAFATLLLSFAACTPEPAKPPELRPRSDALKLAQVTVPAIRAKPVYTGQLLQWRQRFTVTATGSVSLGPGQDNIPPQGLAEECGGFCPLPTGHRGALIALVQEAADTPFSCVFEVGASHESRPECQGRIFLVVNDDDGAYADNSGSFTVEFDTARIPRGNPCRNACLASTGPAVDACIRACHDPEDPNSPVDPVVYCDCAKTCADFGKPAFDDCMEANCAGVPDDVPADCGQRCSQRIEPTLRSCMSSCPPNHASDPCVLPHNSCTMGCTRGYHEAMKTCLQTDCGQSGAMQDCLLNCYSEFDACLESYAPDWCDNWVPDCMPRHERCAYYCASAYFPCIGHEDCQ